MKHDALIGEFLDPPERRPHLGRIRNLTGRLLNAVGPACGVAVFALSKLSQNIFAALIRLAVRQDAIRAGGLHFPPPHFAERGQVLWFGRHQPPPTSTVRPTIVAMPTSARPSWRNVFASMRPRWRSGIR